VAGEERRRRQCSGPGAGAAGWLALDDDDLLHCIESLPPDHSQDEALLEVVRSERHFFIRQEAAKKLRDPAHLKQHSGDRHIGQILVRAMRRDEDVEYLRNLMEESRHLEVRKAAEAQLRALGASRVKPAGED
jgi:hypothetical protein